MKVVAVFLALAAAAHAASVAAPLDLIDNLQVLINSPFTNIPRFYDIPTSGVVAQPRGSGSATEEERQRVGQGV